MALILERKILVLAKKFCQLISYWKSVNVLKEKFNSLKLNSFCALID